jgi:hypothetical protein
MEDTMKKLLALALVLAGVAATPAFADRPFGSSNHTPTAKQTDTRCPMHQGPMCPMRRHAR